MMMHNRERDNAEIEAKLKVLLLDTGGMISKKVGDMKSEKI